MWGSCLASSRWSEGGDGRIKTSWADRGLWDSLQKGSLGVTADMRVTRYISEKERWRMGRELAKI